jgi:hypothetical protein
MDSMIPQTGETIMPPDDIREKLDHRPFVPFRIVLSDGTIYEIRHPELLLLGKRSAVIGLASNPVDREYDRYITVALLHITRLEPLQSPTVSG